MPKKTPVKCRLKTATPAEEADSARRELALEASVNDSGGLSKGTTLRKRIDPSTDEYSGRVAARLRDLREGMGKSVEEMAHALGIKPLTLYRLEACQRRLDWDNVPDFAKAFGLTIAKFLPKD